MKTPSNIAVLAGWLLAALLVCASVFRNPTSFQHSGLAFLIAFVALLLANMAFALIVARLRFQPAFLQAIRIGSKIGLCLAIVLIAGHSIELFGSPSHELQLLRGAGSVILMLGLMGASGSIIHAKTNSVIASVFGTLWAASIGSVLLICYAFSVGLLQSSASSETAAPLVRNNLLSADEITLELAIAAAVLSLLGSLLRTWFSRWPRSLLHWTALLLPLEFLFGLYALWHADSLARVARPPYIFAGLGAIVISLSCVHPVLSALRRTIP